MSGRCLLSFLVLLLLAAPVPEYRRLVAQGVLWTMKLPISKDGLPVEVTEDELKLPSRK
jgi:hypothetical protein